jgi:beta-1,4-mannosyltransferase
VLVFARLRLQRKALVRTLHDLAPYDPPSRLQRAVLRLFDRWTTLWITLTDLTPPPRPGPTVVALHGHYRDWYAGTPREDPVPGRILHFGLIRRYKGTEALLSAFSELHDDSVTLRIVGHAQDREVLTTIERACRKDPRISAIDQYVPDTQLARELTESQLVVLPFDRLTNSGSLMLALSLDRPVLVPATPLTEELAAEVGPGWVLTYRPPLDAQTIAQALEEARTVKGGPQPDLSRREWPAIGVRHEEAFVRAVELARRGSRRGRLLGRA